MNGLRHLPLFLSLALAACGSGGGGEGSGDPGAGVTLTLPLATGDRWLYSVTQEPGSLPPGSGGEELVRVTGTTTLDGVAMAQVDTRRPADFSLLQRHFLHVSDTQLEERFPAEATPYGQPVSAVSLLHFPLVAGESFSAYDWNGLDAGYDYDGDSVHDIVDEQLIVTVAGKETVTTLQGSSYAAVKVTSLRTSVLTYSQGGTATVSTRTEEWLADGIGAVRRLVSTTYSLPWASPYTEQVSYDLLRYNVGGHRSELQAPVVEPTLRTPGPGSTTNDAWLQVHVPFSETIDVSAITEGSLVIENLRGEAMPGDITVSDRELRFRPSAALPDGFYTVMVRGIPDAIGNTLGLHAWTFTVDTSVATDPQQLTPLAVGDRWIYNVTTRENYDAPVLSQRMETVTGATVIQGRSGLIVQSRDPVSFALNREFYVQKSGSAITQLFKAGEAPFGLNGPAITLLHLPINAGDSYQNGHWTGLDAGRDLDGDGVNESLELTLTTTVGNSPEYTWVPAGNWPETVRTTTTLQQVITSSATGGQAVITQTTLEWLAPGIGSVKRVRQVSTTDYSQTTTEELSGYHVGNARSENMRPWPYGRSPFNGTNTAPTAVTLDFDEALDLGALASPALVVTNNSGQAVAGSVETSSRQLRFVPDSALPDGSYHVAVADLFDLVGNAVTGDAWDFTVDTTRPRVVSASLADGATVSTATAITFVMSEPVSVGAFSSPLITLKTAAGADVGYSPTMIGNTLTIKPASLQHGTTYTLTLTASVKDPYGNALASPYSVTFTTPPALLQEPATTLYTRYSNISAVAIGDVDDDGRNDLIIATGMTSVLSDIDSYTLHVFLQQADGSLATPLKTKTFVPPPAGKICPPSGLGIGDVTGDGKTDIVLGETGCGVKIIERAADGSWPNPVAISATNTHRLQYLDMNGDGLKDVVGFNASNANLMSIWYRQAGGGLGAETSHEVASSYGSVAHVRDMNGDGRADFVLNGPSSLPGGLHFGIMLQASNGSFDAPAYYSAGSENVYWDMKIADLNNDGRPDVVGRVRHNTLGSQLAVLYQQADGSLQSPTYYPTDLYTNSLYFGDLNHDGRNDVITNTSSAIDLYLQDGNGLLQGEDRYVGGESIIAVGDLTGDGKSDVVTAGYRNISIYRNIGP